MPENKIQFKYKITISPSLCESGVNVFDYLHFIRRYRNG